MGGNGKNIILRQKQLTNAVPISKCLSEGGEKNININAKIC